MLSRTAADLRAFMFYGCNGDCNGDNRFATMGDVPSWPTQHGGNLLALRHSPCCPWTADPDPLYHPHRHAGSAGLECAACSGAAEPDPSADRGAGVAGPAGKGLG